MKKVIISLATILLSLCFLAVIIAACSNNAEEPETLYTVTYRSNDEAEDPYATEQYAAGEIFATLAADAFGEGESRFLAWYDGTRRISAGESYIMPEGGITFYAQWEGDMTAQLEGMWSGCSNGSEPVGEENDFVVSIRKDEGYAYVILSTVSYTGEDHAEKKENKVLRLAECGEGNYASETESVWLTNNHLVLRLEGATFEFDHWCPLSTAPDLNGVWATGGGEERRSIEFADTVVLSPKDAKVIGKVVGIGEYYLLVLSENFDNGTARTSDGYSMTLLTATPDGNALLVNGDVVFVRV